MMTPALLVRLRPITPWRIGPDSGSRLQAVAILHSDALYAAVCEAMGQLGLLEEWLGATAPAQGEPAVRFSSAFPFQRTALYAPPPQGFWPPGAAAGRARWKGASLLPLGAIRGLLRGELPAEEEWFVDAHSGCLVPAGTRASTGPFRVLRRSFAAVDRRSQRSGDPRTVACIQFAPGSGLWFAAAFCNPIAYAVWAPKVQTALRWLADSGIGGMRSAGFGRSRAPEFQAGTLEELLMPGVNTTTAPRGWWLLSLFSPGAEDTVDWTEGRYQLVVRSGRSNGLLKKSSRLVTEGSLLVSRTPPLGSVRDVAPPGAGHPVWRAGYALALPVPMQVQP